MNRHHMKRPNLWQYSVYELLALLLAALAIYELPQFMTWLNSQ